MSSTDGLPFVVVEQLIFRIRAILNGSGTLSLEPFM